MEHKNKQNIIKHNDLNYFVIYNNASLSISNLLVYDAIIIEAGNPIFTTEILRKFRGHHNSEFYLKPIFLMGGYEANHPLIDNLIDGRIHSLEQLDVIEKKYHRIFMKTMDLFFPKANSYEAQIINKLFNYLYTRQKKELKPYPHHSSSIGYIYPELSVNFAQQEEWKSFDILRIAEKEGLITGKFAEKAYLCNKCKSGFLIYREVCSSCNSTHLHTEDLVHHFPCAYLGPLSDFKNDIDNDLNCPKCYKGLHHIGIDYDKPSVIYTCQDCGKRFQDVQIKTKCMYCYNEMDVEHLIPQEIRSYKVNKKGEMMVLSGYLSTVSEIENIKGTVNKETFYTFTSYEIERLKQNDYDSHVVAVYIVDAGALFSHIGSHSQRIFLEDIIQLLRANIRTSDIITFENLSTILIGLNDIPSKVANSFVKDIIELLKKLIADNYADFKVQVNSSVRTLTIKLAAETQIQRLIDQTLNPDGND